MPENEEERNIQQTEPSPVETGDVQGTTSGDAGAGAEAAPAGETAPQSGREGVLGRLRERYPNESIGEGDDIFGVIGRYMDEDRGRLDEYKQSSDRLMDVINKDQLAGDLFVAMAHGDNPIIFLMRKWGPDILEWVKSPDGEAAMRKATEEFAQKQEQRGRDEEQWEQNVNASLERLRAFAQSHGLDEGRQEAVFDKLWSMGQKFLDGNYTDEDYELALKAIGYDEDVATAREEGEIEGRNTRITERLRRSEPGRSMPTSMQGGGEAPDTGEPEEMETGGDSLENDPFGAMRYSPKRGR